MLTVKCTIEILREVLLSPPTLLPYGHASYGTSADAAPRDALRGLVLLRTAAETSRAEGRVPDQGDSLQSMTPAGRKLDAVPS